MGMGIMTIIVMDRIVSDHAYFDKVQFGGLDVSADKALEWLNTVKNEKFFLLGTFIAFLQLDNT